jgi:hypothetical protein
MTVTEFRASLEILYKETLTIEVGAVLAQAYIAENLQGIYMVLSRIEVELREGRK